MFVPSLSWQNGRFIYKWLKNAVFRRMERFKMLPDRKPGELPRPPAEVARIVSQGGVFRDGEWRL